MRTRRSRYGVYNWGKLNELAAAQLAKLDSKILPTAQVGLLSFADRQVVEIAKVLTIAERSRHEPIILLDEPTSVLEAEEVDIVLDDGPAPARVRFVVFISHRLDEVLRVSDRIYVMTNGRVVAERSPDSLDIAELQQLMLGHELNQEYARKTSNVCGRQAAGETERSGTHARAQSLRTSHSTFERAKFWGSPAWKAQDERPCAAFCSAQTPRIAANIFSMGSRNASPVPRTRFAPE